MCKGIIQDRHQSAVFQPFQLYGGAYSFGGLAESHPIPLAVLHGGEGSSFHIWFHLMTQSTLNLVGIKPGDSSVVIGYQVNEFACTWSAEWFVSCSHIYPGFTGKVSSLTHYPLEPGCEDYFFLDELLLTLNRAWIPSSLESRPNSTTSSSQCLPNMASLIKRK